MYHFTIEIHVLVTIMYSFTHVSDDMINKIIKALHR